MEESKTSENENHEPKKNAWALSEESKAVKVITNQTLKAKNDKSIKEIGTNSPNRNSSKKNKQNDICIEKTEVKSCKVNAANVPGKDLGLVLRDQSHCKAKKSPNSPVKAEKLPVSQAKVERASSLQAKTEKPSKSPNSPVKTEKTPSSPAIVAEKTLNSQRKAEKAPGSQMKSEKVPSLPAEAEKVPNLLLKENMRQTELQHIGKKIPSSFTSVDKVNISVAEEEKSAMKNSQRSQKQQTCTDNTGDSDDSASGTEDISDDLSKMKSDESNKENSSEMDYLENATVIDESTLTPEQRLGLKQAEERLERDHIFRLEKRSPEYTNCRYLCKLCLIHIENIQGAHKHIKEKRHKKNILREVSACWRLTVRVLEARGLGWADLLSEADPYVVLQLPTAPGIKFKTKTVTNSSHPVWNETFTFLIQGQVKNVLEMTLYDEDTATQDDAWFKVLYDVSDVLPGKLLRKTFSLSAQGPEELDMEFLIEKMSDCPENLITNNVLVARELSRLDVHVVSMAVAADQDELELVLKGSYEDTQTSALGTASVFCFHYMAAQEAELSGRLRSSISSGWNSGNSAGHLIVPLRSLAMGKEVTIEVPATNAPGVKLQLKSESCPEELAVHLSFDLCAEERAFLSRRKQVVAKALKQALQLDGDLQEDEVPVIGIMATGGGARAMTSLYGHLLALQKLGLLDCVTYFSGISGSTWTMAHLYGDPEWSQKDLKGPISHVREHLAKSKLEAFSPECLASYHRELEQRAEQGHTTTFVDLWGLVLEFMLHGQVVDQKLSGQRAALERGQNPLPLYLSLSVKENNLQTLDFKEWVEFSPYEVGFLKYGGFVPPELFGSEFFMGRLMKRLPESRICFLEGIWSNIFSLNLLDAWYDLTSSGDTWRQHLRDKIRDLEVPPASSGTSSWPETLWMQPGTALAQMFKGFLTSRPLYQHSSNFLRGLQMHKDYCAHKDFTTWADCQPDSSPNQLTPQEPQLCLVDAGYFINTSCPAMFRPGRRLDLIISFDYSLSSPFEVLQQTELDFRARGLPFPRVEPSPKDRRQPRECHLFSDPACPDAPVVLHFPLVNASFKDHSAPGVQRGPAELSGGHIDLTGVTSPYSMFNMTYKEEDFDRLVQLSDYNVRNSQDTILQALRTVLKHRAQEARPPRVQT